MQYREYSMKYLLAAALLVFSAAIQAATNRTADTQGDEKANNELLQQERQSIDTAIDEQQRQQRETEALFEREQTPPPVVGNNVSDETSPESNDYERPQAKADAENKTTFDVWEYRVEGNNVLGKEWIERAVYPYLGPEKTIESVQAARSNLEQVYKNNGYPTVFVDIPEQDVDNGVVTLRVTEGKIGRVSITGARYYSLGKIREQVPALQEGTTPYMPELQEQLADLNKGVAGRAVTPLLRPGDTPGKLDVELQVKDEFPLHGSIDINDRFIVNTSRLRLNANLRYDNLWQKGHSASLGYVVAPQDRSEVEVIFGTYVFRFPGSNKLLALYAVNSASDIASTGEINQIGNGVILGARAIFPLPAFESYTHNLTLGVDYKDFDESTQLLGFDVLNTPASYLSFIPAYTGNWFHEGGRTSLTVEAHLAPRGLGNTPGEFENKRVGARPNFAFFQGSLSHEQRLPLNTMLKLSLSGQLADAPLIANEQFSAGGMDTVRGYFEAQQLSDDGVIGSIELHSPSIASYLAEFFNDVHFYGFFDTARMTIQQPLPDQISRFTLSSVGMGMEMRAFDALNSNLLWAYVLDDNGTIQSGDSRVHFNVGYEF